MFEAVVHQHMPMFHMEHCVFAATLSNGKDYRDCGRPCETHKIELRDRVGQAHPVLADVGCRNTVYNAQAQSAADYIPRMRELGLRHFRVELVRETAEQTVMVMNQYSRVLSGLDNSSHVKRSLRVLSQLGVTAGTLERE
jgi:putative protease